MKVTMETVNKIEDVFQPFSSGETLCFKLNFLVESR